MLCLTQVDSSSQKTAAGVEHKPGEMYKANSVPAAFYWRPCVSSYCSVHSGTPCLAVWRHHQLPQFISKQRHWWSALAKRGYLARRGGFVRPPLGCWGALEATVGGGVDRGAALLLADWPLALLPRQQVCLQRLLHCMPAITHTRGWIQL